MNSTSKISGAMAAAFFTVAAPSVSAQTAPNYSKFEGFSCHDSRVFVNFNDKVFGQNPDLAFLKNGEISPSVGYFSERVGLFAQQVEHTSFIADDGAYETALEILEAKAALDEFHCD